MWGVEGKSGERKVQRATEQASPETKRRGKVPDLEYTVLREHRVEMVNKLVPQKVIPYLKKNKVIDKDDVEMIEKKCKDLRRKGAETMLDILYNSGSWAFRKLIAALQEANFHEMAQNLTANLSEKKTTEPQLANTKNQTDRLSGIEFDVLRDNHERLVNELDSSVLKNHLFQNGLITEDDMERISKKEEELRKEGAEEMVTIIYKSAIAFQQLLKSLIEAGYYELSSKLESDLKQKKKERDRDQTEGASPEEKTEKDKIEKTEKVRTTKVPLLEFTVLREYRDEMVYTLDPENVLPHLRQNSVIDQEDVEKIEKICNDLKRKGTESIFGFHHNPVSCSFKELIAALQQADYQEITHKLKVDLQKKHSIDAAEEMVTIMSKSVANVFPQLLKSLYNAGHAELSWNLDMCLKEKHAETEKRGLTIDLNSLEFPDYPHRPQLHALNSQSGSTSVLNRYHRSQQLETVYEVGVISNWRQKIAKWKQDDAGKFWCVAMNNWFKDHIYTSLEELKMVVKDWLSNMEKVVKRDCLEIDRINLILDVTEKLQRLDRNNSFIDKLIFEDILKDIVPDFLTTEDKEEFVKTKNIEKQRLLEQQWRVFTKLKQHLLEIIENNYYLHLFPIDTNSCELAGYFHSVVDDVREIWNKLH